MKKILIILVLLFSSSEILAKKIVMHCVGSPTLLVQKNENSPLGVDVANKLSKWDYSTNGQKGKAVIDTSKETIKFNMMSFDIKFTHTSLSTKAETEKTNGVWWLIIVGDDSLGTTQWLEDTPLRVTHYDCKKEFGIGN